MKPHIFSGIRGEPHINKYGDIALRAIQLIVNEEKPEPLNIWKVAASEMFREVLERNAKVVRRMQVVGTTFY